MTELDIPMMAAVLTRCPDAMALCSSVGRIECVNGPFEELFGRNSDSWIGQPLDTVVPEVLRWIDELANDTVAPEALGSRTTRVALVGHAIGGERPLLDLTLRSARIGTVPHVVIALRPASDDAVAAQNLAQQIRVHTDELQRSEEKYRVVTQWIRDAVIVTEPSGRIVAWNQGAERVFGYTADEAVGQPVTLLMPVGKRGDASRGIRGSTAMPDGVLAVLGRRKGGEEFPAEMSLATWQSGTSMYFTSVVRDVTDRRAAEALLARQTAELTRANEALEKGAEAKDAFLASMSHEIRTPLNAVLGLAEALSEGIYGPVGERQMQPLKTIEASGRHLLDLINDVLDLSRIEAGAMTLRCTDVSVTDACRESLAFITEAASRQDLTVRFDHDPGAHTVWADERRLRQMLINLLANAAKFTPRGGTVGLDVRVDRDEGCVRFLVWDTGIGIAVDELDRLFRPFRQVENGVVQPASGSGLGLSLVRHMVDLHGGSVSVDSTVGGGSRFALALPSRAPSAGEEVARARPAGQRPSVLIVDGHEPLREALRAGFESAGFDVQLARSGFDALEQTTVRGPDAVILERSLAGLDSLDTLERLRTRGFAGPAIVLSALVLASDRERCLGAGASDYVARPVDPARLAALVRRRLGSS